MKRNSHFFIVECSSYSGSHKKVYFIIKNHVMVGSNDILHFIATFKKWEFTFGPTKQVLKF